MATSVWDDVATMAVAKCDELEALASGMWKDMAVLDEGAAKLAATLEKGVSALGRQVTAIKTALTSASTHLGTATTDVETALQEMGKDADALAAGVESAGSRITAALQRVVTESTTLSTAILDHATAFDKDNAAVDAGVKHLTGVLENGCDDAVAALRTSIEGLDAARGKLEEQQGGWAAVLDALTVGVAERVAGLIHDLAPTADVHADGVIATLNTAITAHKALVDGLAAELAGETTASLLPTRSQMEAGHETVDADVGECSEAVTGRAAALEPAAAAVQGELERIASDLGALDGIGKA